MKNRPDPAATFERRPELMAAHNTGESRYEKRVEIGYIYERLFGFRQKVYTEIKIHQQRWKWDDGTCAGWRDVPIIVDSV